MIKAVSRWRFCCCSRRNNPERSAETRSSYVGWQISVQALLSLCFHSHAAGPSRSPLNNNDLLGKAFTPAMGHSGGRMGKVPKPASVAEQM